MLVSMTCGRPAAAEEPASPSIAESVQYINQHASTANISVDGSRFVHVTGRYHDWGRQDWVYSVEHISLERSDDEEHIGAIHIFCERDWKCLRTTGDFDSDTGDYHIREGPYESEITVRVDDSLCGGRVARAFDHLNRLLRQQLQLPPDPFAK
jgi:hypothetical protein